LPAFIVDIENPTAPAKASTPVRVPFAASKAVSLAEPTPWWDSISLKFGGFLTRFRRRPGTYKPGKPPSDAPDPPLAPDRVRDQLASHHALLLGHEWNARRLELERRIVLEMPCLDGPERVALWSRLAAVDGSIGHSGESALCCLNAVWESEAPNRDAIAAWWKAEIRAARLGEQPLDWLRQSGPASARTAAAYLCRAAAESPPPNDALEHRRGLLHLVQKWEAELPVRAVWLSHAAAAELAGGDPLALARCRDRLLARLDDFGPSLDLDAPGFLRFRRGPGGDRFQTARDWLMRLREPMHRWLAELQGHGKLQWAGIDPESVATLAYAELIWAWGFGELGDRSRAKELEGAARTALAAVRGPGGATGVHERIAELFAAHIRGGTEAAVRDPAADRFEHRADDLARYAVGRLQSSLGVLNENPFRTAFEGREIVGFLGDDDLGERLRKFLAARGNAAQTPWEARRLLGVDEADPTAATMPRILFALLERADELDANLAAAVVPLTFQAVELIPEWVRLGLQDRDAAATSMRYGKRMLANAARAAVWFHLPASLQDLAEQLIDRVADRDGLYARLALSCSDELIRALRRLGLATQAGVLATRLNAPGPISAAKLGLTGGLYAAGDDEAAGRLLDEARTKLFVRKIADDRHRTEMALAYVAALATAPHGIALGRLEELFQRLEMVGTTGAANRWYTLNPLRLVDAVVRAVIGDDTALGPAARAWLDDDEFLIRRRIARDFAVVLKSENLD